MTRFWVGSAAGVRGWWVMGRHCSWVHGPGPDGLYFRVTWERKELNVRDGLASSPTLDRG